MQGPWKALVVVLALAGVGCGGGGAADSAEKRYGAYVDKWGPTLDEFGEAFGEENVTDETFQEYVAGLEDCEPLDAEAAGMLTMMIGSDLTKRGHSVAEFVKDSNNLLAAIRDEGLCK